MIIAYDLGHLLQIKPVNIRRHMCRWTANRYDDTRKAFMLKGKAVQITTADVHNLMGLPMKGQEFHPLASMRSSKLFDELKDKKTSNISLKSLLQKMNQKELPLDEFMQCFVLYAIGKILCPTTAPYVHS